MLPEAVPEAVPEAAPVAVVESAVGATGPIAAGVAPAAVAVAGAAATGPVVLTAKEDVWVKIYDKATNTTIKSGILKAGERFAVPADPPRLMLWTGKAGALDISVGGRAIAPLGGPVETVRDVSLAAADLSARPVAGALPGATPGAAPVAPTGPKPIATIPGA